MEQSDARWVEDADASPRPLHRIRVDATTLTLCFAAGIATAWNLETAAVWPWIAAAAVMLAATVICQRFRRLERTFGGIVFLAAAAALGGAWLTLRHFHLSPDDIAAMTSDEPQLVHVRGLAATPPSVHERTSGSMARYGHQAPSTYFQLDVEAVIDRLGRETPVHGQVLVKCAEMVQPFTAGAAVEVKGALRRFAPPANPGEFDRATYARVLGQAGVLEVASRELISVTDAQASWPAGALRAFRDSMQARASGWLLAELPEESRRGRDALLSALLLGERGADLTDVNDTFRRVGLAHLLAISGLHLSIFVGLLLLAVRLRGDPRAWHGWVLIVAVLVYLFLIEIRLPVLRAAIMIIVASAGIAIGWRIRIRGLIALSALILLCWRPQQLFDAGFQLSYGVVMGLIWFAPRLRLRWFGPRDQNAPSTSAMLGELLRDLFAATIVAWLIATPLVAHHFGLISPLAPIASVLVLPVVAAVLALGYLKIVLGALLPSAALFLSGPLAASADILLAIVEGVDAVPFSVLHLKPPPALWAAAALAVTIAWLLHTRRFHRRLLWPATIALLAWLFWPLLPLRAAPALRIDMLAVGDGSCYVVRSGRSTVIFDAGSSTDLNAGRNMIIPAMQRLGVRRIDAIMLSHANLDHMSAVIELAEHFSVDRVFITPQFLAAVESDALGPSAFLHDELVRRVIDLEIVTAGDARSFGGARWTWLHPQPGRAYRTVNDSSMTIRIDAAGGRAGALLAGDVQREAMAELLGDPDALDVEVMELPHHGSFHDMAVEFVRAASPRIILQSTGWRRLRDDPWEAVLEGRDFSDHGSSRPRRLITARDGACTVVIDEDGEISVTRSRVNE